MSRDEPWAARRSASASSPFSSVRRFLSESDEEEALVVLREQFRHERRITSDDVRFVVRAVASHGGVAGLPPDFPPTRWILEFKRANGFAQVGGFAFGLLERVNVVRGGSRSSSLARVTASSVSSGGISSSSDEESERHGGRYAHSTRPSYDSDSPLQRTRRQQQQRRSMVVDDRRAGALWQQREQAGGREELSSNTSSASLDSENGTTTGVSSSSSVSADLASPSRQDRSNSTYESSQDSASTSVPSEKRGYKLSHTVPPETWEKAIAAVEQQGMSLRAAAKIYGVHFAALHRRVKKRAQGGQSTKGNNGYFHPSDEAGIMRVVVARAEMGVLMTFDELMKLVETAALRKLPNISVENARKLMVRFQTRNEQSIRHIIEDWPPPLPIKSSSTGASHYHLEHPGYDYGSESSSLAGMQRSFAARAVWNTDGPATAAAVPAAPSQFVPPSRVGPFSPNNIRPIVLPSMNLNRSPRYPPDSSMSPPPQQRLVVTSSRGPCDQDAGRSHPMFV